MVAILCLKNLFGRIWIWKWSQSTSSVFIS